MELPPDAGRVRLVVRGVIGRNPDGAAEICPYPDACFGIPIAGSIDEGLDGAFVKVSGTFDGAALVVDGAPEEIPLPDRARSYEPPCDEIPAGGRLDPDAENAIARYLESVPDAHAATWIDPSQRVMTYWFVGDDVTEYRGVITELADGAAVCVAGGARWSRSELQATVDRAREMTSPDAVGVDELDNVVVVGVRVLDPAMRGDLATLTDRVEVTAFIELLDDPRDRLPALRPVVEGDLAILTQRDGGRGGADALGRFIVRFDEELGCVFFDSPPGEALGTKRFVPVWPDGYTATSSPLVIRDFDGLTVANEGDIVELGGGYYDASTIDRRSDGAGTCGATGGDAMFVVTR